MKKNTLLYLDAELVRLAKKLDVNISEIAEAALRDKLLPYLSAGSRTLLFGQHLEDLKAMGRCYVLPFALKSLRLKNVGVLKEFDAKFTRGINLILGGTASGKSTVIRAIAYTLGKQPQLQDWSKAAVTHGRKQGTIELELFERAIRYDLYEGGEIEGAKCVLLDGPLARVSDPKHEHKRRFIRWLKKKYAQAIVASRDEGFAMPEIDNIMRLGLSSG